MSNVSFLRRYAAAAFIAGISMFVLPAQALTNQLPARLTGAMGGNWYNPAQDGHGVQIEVLDGDVATVTWYTYDSQGRPFWLMGVGAVDGHRIDAQMFEFGGGRSPSKWSQGKVSSREWGFVRIDFSDCDHGKLSWVSSDPEFGQNDMHIQRLTRAAGTQCGAIDSDAMEVSYTFEDGANGFTPIFADYEPGKEAAYELQSRWERLPEPFSDRHGILLSGNNLSSDLAMLVQRKLTGLRRTSGASYQVEFEMEIATRAPAGCLGAGGAPGEGVSVKMGAYGGFHDGFQTFHSPTEGMMRLNPTIGGNAEGNLVAKRAGDIATSQACASGPGTAWELKTLSTRGQFHAMTPTYDGSVWIIGGVDSGFAGRTEIYITRFTVRFKPLK